MIKKIHELADVKLTENDALIGVISHEGVRMFHCCLPVKYTLKNGGNHLLHENIFAFYKGVMDATQGKAKYYFYDDEFAELFWFAGRTYETHIAGKSMNEIPMKSTIKLRIVQEIVDKFLENAETVTSEQLGLSKIA